MIVLACGEVWQQVGALRGKRTHLWPAARCSTCAPCSDDTGEGERESERFDGLAALAFAFGIPRPGPNV